MRTAIVRRKVTLRRSVVETWFRHAWFLEIDPDKNLNQTLFKFLVSTFPVSKKSAYNIFTYKAVSDLYFFCKNAYKKKSDLI